MKAEHAHILREAFSIYRDEDRETPFFLGDGWYTLLSDLGRKAEGLPFFVTETKEKFGTLRVYYTLREGLDTVPEEVYAQMEGLIREAEAASRVTCETCGAPGTLVQPQRWLRTACETCFKGAA